MGRHAFLIMAHKDLPLLNNLIRCLDDSRNSLFVHIDIKSDIDLKSIFSPRNANIVFTNRLDVNWGGDSQIRAELELMKAAVKTGNYDYYHLISGQDLPLKNQQEFHEFFERSSGKSYISFDHNFATHEQFVKRIGRFYFFQNRIGRNSGHIVALLYKLQTKLLILQEKIGIDRTRNCPYKLYKGANWFSITDNMVKYLLSKEKEIKRYFSKSLCADEIFLQTILKNSPYADDIIDDSLREIDWERGQPYTYTIEDLDLLLSSSKLFGRKFSTETDSAIIKEICQNNGVNYI